MEKRLVSRWLSFVLAALVVGGMGLGATGCGGEVTTGDSPAEVITSESPAPDDGGGATFSAESCGSNIDVAHTNGTHGWVKMWFGCGKIHAEAKDYGGYYICTQACSNKGCSQIDCGNGHKDSHAVQAGGQMWVCAWQHDRPNSTKICAFH